MRLSPLPKTVVSTSVVVMLFGAVIVSFLAFRPAVRDGLQPDHSGAAGPVTPAAGQRPSFRVGITGYGAGGAGLAAQQGATSLFHAEGLDVSFTDLKLSAAQILERFDRGELDVLLLSADMAELAASTRPHLRAFFFGGWSRGNVGLIAAPQFTSIESLKNARIAVTRETPTHYFLLKMLDDSSLTPDEVAKIKKNLVFVKRSDNAAHMFKRGEVDAAVAWDPELTDAIQNGRGKLLISTAQATNLIGGILVADQEFLDRQAAAIPAFLRAWLGGAARLGRDETSSLSAIAKFFGQTEDAAREVLKKNAVADFPMNRSFFGLEKEDSPYRTLVENANKLWQSEGVIASGGPAHHLEARTEFLETFTKEYEDVPDADDTPPPAPMAAPHTLAKTRISVFFAPGSAVLDDRGRADVARFALTVAKVYKNLRVRVEGHTDSTGTLQFNRWVAGQRAQAVCNELVRRHGIDRARLDPVGKPPTPGGKNLTSRRSEFFLQSTAE